MTGDSITAPPQVSAPESSDFLADVIAGLSSSPRMIPSKYFYDERGAALFQKICELPEYYVTRTEIDILDRSRADIASQLGPNVELIGLGTGAGTKTRILIEALENPAVYIPVDISEKQLRQCTFRFDDADHHPAWSNVDKASVMCSSKRKCSLTPWLFQPKLEKLFLLTEKDYSSFNSFNLHWQFADQFRF